MSDQYYTPEEVADRYKRKPETVRRWIREGKLEAKKVRGRIFIPAEALQSLEQSIEQTRQHPKTGASAQQPDWGRATMSRREFLHDVGVGVTYSLIILTTGGVLAEYKRWRERSAEQAKIEEKVKDLFGELFGAPDKIRFSAEGAHPDNAAAGRALRPVLGMYDQPPAIDTGPDSSQLKILTEGDVVLLGGPASTHLTRIVWEFEGSNNRELKRDPNPILPLRFYGLAEVNNLSVQQCGHVGWRLESVGHIRTINWPFMDTKKKQLIVPERGPKKSTYLSDNKIEIQGESVWLPYDNYLIVTKLPNFLSSRRQGHPSSWPQLLVFQGNNGVGTRAAELLLQPAGLEALEHVQSKLQGVSAFQVIFRVCDIELTKQGFHRFRKIEALDWAIEPLDIDEKIYDRAHEKAVKAYEEAIDFEQDEDTR